MRGHAAVNSDCALRGSSVNSNAFAFRLDGGSIERDWVGGLLHGEAGTSLASQTPVSDLLRDDRCAPAPVPSGEQLGAGVEARGMPLQRTLERMASLSREPRHARLRRPVQRAFLPAVVRRADLVVAAVGRAEFVRGSWIKPGAIVIDVGIQRIAAAGIVLQ